MDDESMKNRINIWKSRKVCLFGFYKGFKTKYEDILQGEENENFQEKKKFANESPRFKCLEMIQEKRSRKKSFTKKSSTVKYLKKIEAKALYSPPLTLKPVPSSLPFNHQDVQKNFNGHLAPPTRLSLPALSSPPSLSLSQPLL